MPDLNKMQITVYHISEATALSSAEERILALSLSQGRQGLRRSVIVCRPGSALHEEALRHRLEVLTLPLWGGFDPVSAYCLKLASAVHGAVLHPHTEAAARLAAFAGLLGAPPAVDAGAAGPDESDAAYVRALSPLYAGAGAGDA